MKLSPITTPRPAPPFQVLDIETMKWTKFIVLGFYDGKDYVEFRTLKKFMTFLKTKNQEINAFAHFGGKFDLLFLLKTILQDDELQINNIIPRGSSILGLEVLFGEKKFNFRDSSALLPFSLKSISENFGTDILKGEWDHSKTRGYSKGLSRYLRADCISLYQSLEKYYQWPLIQKSGPAYTMASQAMKVFRTFLKAEIPALPMNSTNFCRKSYLGGRTEIFKPFYNGGKLFEYDVSSLYPFVMVSGIYPVDTGYKTFSRDRSKLGIYEASVSVGADTYLPCLGVIRDNKYIFPTGNFKGFWTSAELDYAETQGYKIKIIRGHEFKTREKIFDEYINNLYLIKESSPKNSVSYILAKLLMNSLYGRFGMNLERENISFELKEGNREYHNLKIGRKNIQLFTEPTTLNSFTHVAISSFVTSYARIHCHKIMSSIQSTLFYTDTDSFFTTSELPTGNKLGDLKLENTYESACFLLPKTYIATSRNKIKIAMKGFDKKKIQHFSFEDFTSALEGDLKRMKVQNEPKFATFKSALAQKKLVTMTKASEKQLRSTYSKRIILKNGDTKPINLLEE